MGRGTTDGGIAPGEGGIHVPPPGVQGGGRAKANAGRCQPVACAGIHITGGWRGRRRQLQPKKNSDSKSGGANNDKICRRSLVTVVKLRDPPPSLDEGYWKSKEGLVGVYKAACALHDTV